MKLVHSRSGFGSALSVMLDGGEKMFVVGKERADGQMRVLDMETFPEPETGIEICAVRSPVEIVHDKEIAARMEQQAKKTPGARKGRKGGDHE